MTALSEKIKHSLQILTEMHGITEAELCRKANIPQATLNRLLTGVTEDPRASTLNEIAKFFGVSVDQILGNQPIAKTVQGNHSTKAVTYVPVFAWSDIHRLNTLMQKMTPSSWSHWIETEPSIGKNCFAVEVIGESMWPQFNEGSVLIVNPEVSPKHRDFVIAYLHKKKEGIFRQYIEDGQDKILKPVNFAYPSTFMNKDDKLMGVVLQSRINLRSIL